MVSDTQINFALLPEEPCQYAQHGQNCTFISQSVVFHTSVICYFHSLHLEHR